MSKLLGYILSILGLIIIVLSFNTSRLPIPAAITPAYVMIAGICLVILGIVFIMNKPKSSSKISQSSEEVPIYQGEGKSRKIVGYQKSR
ncbi:hypothetical protein HYW76_00375 [Candidatus Pacearchaeota archaeon]|nr:hypothetical protein [Candidatus Pacearchaeota archaeon]